MAADCRGAAEILEIAAWYDRLRAAAREAFLNSVTDSLASIQVNPLQYQIVRGTVRRVKVGRFPYALLFSIAGDDVVVTICIHTSRDPKRWHGRFAP